MSENAPTHRGRILLILGRLALAAIFLFASYAKLKPPGHMAWSAGSVRVSLALFAMQVDSYQLLSTDAANVVAHLLPPFELLLGLWLLSGVLLRYSALVATLLLTGFFSVLVRSYAAGLEIDCGCFGPGRKLGPGALLEDGFMLILAIAVTLGAFAIRRNRGERQASAPAGAPAAESSR